MTEELQHHGIKGQRWGVRRYQNTDGSLTEAGKKRYAGTNGDFEKAYKKDPDGLYGKLQSASSKLDKSKKGKQLNGRIAQKTREVTDNSSNYSKSGWKTHTAYDEWSKADDAYRNSKGLARIPKYLKKQRKWDQYRSAGDREIYNRKSFETSREYDKKRQEAIQKATASLVDKKAGILLRDLGYDDTKKGRDALKRLGVI